jgi:hypothetical protein
MEKQKIVDQKSFAMPHIQDQSTSSIGTTAASLNSLANR